MLRPDLADQGAQVFGAGFAFRGKAFWGEEVNTVFGAVIAKRVMSGDDAAARARQRGPGGAEVGVQRIEALEIAVGGGGVGGGAGRVCGDEAGAKIGDVGFDVGHALEGMRVRAAIGGLAWGDAGGRDHQTALEGGGLGEAIHPTLEAQPVDDQDIGLGDGAQVRWFGLIDMRVLIRTDQHGGLQAGAGELLHEVREDGETGHDADGRGGVGGSGERGQSQAQGVTA